MANSIPEPVAKDKKAVALHYEPGTMAAPRVVATGRGAVADRIVALAREAGVPVHADPQLAGVLATLDLEAYIPPELYQMVAQLLAFVYQLDHRFSQHQNR